MSAGRLDTLRSCRFSDRLGRAAPRFAWVELLTSGMELASTISEVRRCLRLVA